jgi:hypothetical protein
MDSETLFYSLLEAESEADALRIVERAGLSAEENWTWLGGVENNFSTVASQHSDPTGAVVEKLINAIDAMLMVGCFSTGVDPEGVDAPKTMTEAVDQFFGVKDGRLGLLPNKQLRELAQSIQLVAVGSKDAPSYLIVDQGEGQTPKQFPSTFLSLGKSNKLRIPFVQGKFNAGGTGVLPFCGTENLQLVASRRNPAAPSGNDPTANLWGFTLIRRMEPTEHDNRRSSVYVYLAPKGEVLTFSAASIRALPGEAKKNQAPPPYVGELPHGTVIKLFNYRWKAKSLATADARFELEKYLHSPCLPIRITETRSSYKANTYSTSLSGVWAAIDLPDDSDGHAKLEPGFPAPATAQIDNVGELAYKVAVFRAEVDARRVPHGVFFTINGQVHGEAPADFVSRRLGFEYLRSHLLVSVDCLGMAKRAREDFFMASRDRIRRDENYDRILARLETELKTHPGLQALNAARRAKIMEKALGDEQEVRDTFQELLKSDPTLKDLLSAGTRLTTKVGPTTTSSFVGLRFPTFFKLHKEPSSGLVRDCPVNRSIKLDFDTDATNDYFERDDSPGELVVRPVSAYADYRAWNGTYTVRFRPPKGAAVGDEVKISVAVTDADRASRSKPPFDSSFTIRIGKPDHSPARPSGEPNPGHLGRDPEGGDETPEFGLPNVKEIRRSQWSDFDPPFDGHQAFRVVSDGGAGFDYVLNLDGEYLLTELRRAKDQDKELFKYWFRWGLLLVAMGMQQHFRRTEKSSPEHPYQPNDPLVAINQVISGAASVIVPVIRSLYKGPSAPIE